MRQQSSDGYIKIGFSIKVASRRNALQTASPYKIEILALLEESRIIENVIHIMLKDSKITGEWFYPTEEVLRCIECVNNNEFPVFIQEASERGKI